MFEIGGSLREARLKRNLTPADVQKAIRIRDRYLQALEEERWELLPGDAYVKGFLRTYADYLGLDGNLYVAGLAAWQLSGSGGRQGVPPPSTSTTTTSHHSTKPKKKQRKQHVSTGALPTAAVVVASRGNSWLWVRSGSAAGPTVYEGTLLQGKTLPVNLKKGPVWIRIGDPPSIDVRLGGKLVHGLPTQVGNVLLTRRGIRPA